MGGGCECDPLREDNTFKTTLQTTVQPSHKPTASSIGSFTSKMKPKRRLLWSKEMITEPKSGRLRLLILLQTTSMSARMKAGLLSLADSCHLILQTMKRVPK